MHPGHFATQQGTPFYPAGMSAADWSTLVFTLPRRKMAWVHPTMATFFFFGPSAGGGGYAPSIFVVFCYFFWSACEGNAPMHLSLVCVCVFIFYFWCNLGKALRAVTRGTCQRRRRLTGGDPSPGWLPEVRDLGIDLFFNYF